MNDILILSRNIEFCKGVINNIQLNSRISNLSSSYDEAIDNIEFKRPQMIIVETEIKYYMIVNLIDKIRRIKYYNPTLVLINSLNLYDIEQKYEKVIIIKEKNNKFLQLLKVLKYIELEEKKQKVLDEELLSDRIYKIK